MSQALFDPIGMNVYVAYPRARFQDFVLWRVSVTEPIAATRIDDATDVPAETSTGLTAIRLALVPKELDRTELYYSVAFPTESERYTQSGLYRVPSDGGAPVRVLAAEYARGIGTHRGEVYFSGIDIEGTEGGAALVRLPAEGGAPIVLLADPAHPGAVPTAPGSFAVGPMGIFWATARQTTLSTQIELAHLPLEGGAPRALFALPETSTLNDDESYGLAVRSFTAGSPTLASAPIYFDVIHWVFGQRGTTDLMRLAVDDQAPTTVVHVDHIGAVGSVVFDGPHLYFAYSGDPDSPGYGIGKVDRCGCPAP